MCGMPRSSHQLNLHMVQQHSDYRSFVCDVDHDGTGKPCSKAFKLELALTRHKCYKLENSQVRPTDVNSNIKRFA